MSKTSKMQHNEVFIALGANESGPWGKPGATLCRALGVLQEEGFFISECSRIYRTPPHPGAGLMQAFCNAVVRGFVDRSPAALLRLLKDIERRAGRRAKARWSARTLDLDLIDHGGRVLNWPARTRPGGALVLPHPLMHLRGFVLVPLAEIAPRWRHPVLGLQAATLLKHEPGLSRGIAPA